MLTLDLCQRELAALAAVRATCSLREWREAHMDGNAHNVAPSLATGYRNLHCFVMHKPWWAQQVEVHQKKKTGMEKGLKVSEK